ncbi:hypothetical protein KSD_65490 [Ktedonobacter sp. SOSP1-85]|nr:hypothetical protein KSD_65490 [Ktedonobacter sp. SOSP1-85]
MYTMQTIWNRIEGWLKIYAPEALDNLLPGVDDDDIQEIEVELGYQFPEDVRASLRIHNGTIDRFADIWGLLNVDDILRQQQVQLKVLRSLQEGVVWWWYPHLLPLASDGAGDLLCVDVAPELKERVGQIIQFDHETGSHWVAPSFQALLSAFVDHLESGKYALDAFGNLKSKEFLFDRPQLPPGSKSKYY